MEYEELINRLRDVPSWAIGTETEVTMLEAADALEADEQRIAELSLDNKMLKNTIDADKGVMLDRIRYLESQLPKEGEWVVEEIDDRGDKWCKWRCSVCREVVKRGWRQTEDGEKPKWKHCPNCGALMRKGAER